MSTDERPRRLPAGRQADLAAYIAEVGQVTVAQIAERFAVSIDTVRRDLDQLDADGVLVRTHGGAVRQGAVPRNDSALDVRLRMQTEQKEAIGELAAELIIDGSVIVINSGTTTLALVRHLRKHRDLTIATNNLRLPVEISGKVFRDLYMFGGAVRTITQATTGPVRFPFGPGGQDTQIMCDLALIAVGAVSVDGGFSTSNLADGSMMAEMMTRAKHVAVLADSTKFDRQLFAQVGGLGVADYLVTDAAPTGELAAALAEAGVRVVSPEHPLSLRAS